MGVENGKDRDTFKVLQQAESEAYINSGQAEKDLDRILWGRYAEGVRRYFNIDIQQLWPECIDHAAEDLKKRIKDEFGVDIDLLLQLSGAVVCKQGSDAVKTLESEINNIVIRHRAQTKKEQGFPAEQVRGLMRAFCDGFLVDSPAYLQRLVIDRV